MKHTASAVWGIFKYKGFPNPNSFPSSDVGNEGQSPTQLGPLLDDRHKLSAVPPPLRLMADLDPVSTLCVFK
jgi:hypothetical protein